MATLKQRTAFKKILENTEKGNPKTAGELLLESGYSKDTAIKPCQVIESKGFQGLLAEIDDKVILKRFQEILVDSDKRASIQAGVELLKLKNRYPEKSNVGIALFGGVYKEESIS